ncbi:MAG TPA: sensor domain-containing protein [Mycobacteriales bacterium]|nr:sensor domain-containing protein [Mycobacteriales bacterium]
MTALFQRRTWAELLYCLVGLPLGVAGFVFAVTSLSVSLSLAITLIGFPLLAVALAVARGFGSAYRGLAGSLLGLEVAAPRPRPTGVRIRARLTDRVAWRAMLFMLLRFPVAIIDFTFAVSFYVYGFGGATYWIWWRYLPWQRDDHHVLHHGLDFGPNYFLDTPERIAVTTAVGVVLFLLAPWVVRGVLSLDRLLIRGLLGPVSSAERIRELEDTRSRAVEDSAAALRRIERDLHDGAQARLVSLAMTLGLAKEELADSDDETAANRARALVEAAHHEAKATIVDLRDLARGIHPPALDRGLAEALETLAARCAVPTTLRVDVPRRPTPAVESIVYFSTAELLTNVVKHSGAHHAAVDVRVTDGQLFLRVSDDGAGGADVARAGGSGLAGLTERVATVDGRLEISSPEGGPTLVTIGIPV